MKILTLNTHSYQEENQLEKLEYLAKIIKEEGYDVIALQEVNQFNSCDVIDGEIKKSNYLLLLCNKLKEFGLNYNFRWDYHHVGYDIYDEGTGILYKGDALLTEGDFVGNSKDTNFWKTRKFTMTSLEIGKEVVDFYSCHLGWWNDPDNPFEKQVDDLLDHMKKRGNKAFLMGDFNNSASIKNEGYDYLIKKGLYDTYALAEKKDNGITVSGVIAGWEGKCSDSKRIDFIFTNKIVDIKSSLTIFNGENRDIISDHFGVQITL